MEPQVVSLDANAPASVATKITNTVGVAKANMSVLNASILGILAGVYISFGAALATLVGHDLSKFMGLGFAKFMIGGVFSVGLMLVIIAGAELFTGNNLMIMSVLGGKVSFGKVLNKWIIVYIANFIGSVLIAYFYFKTDLWKGGGLNVGVFALKIANAKVNLAFGAAFYRAILCNWLVCLAVCLAIASRNVIGKIFSCFFPIMAFVALGFEHCVANMYFVPMGIFLKGTAAATKLGADLTNLTWGGFFMKNLLPVTLGNVVGGVFFVGVLYWITLAKKD